MNGYVQSTTENNITTIEFFHPSSNALPIAILNELAAVITQEGENPESVIIILKSGGEKTFCAGASFDELMAISTLEEGTIFFSGFASVLNAMRRCPKLIIGRVQGKAVGGGVGLAASADYCFATKYASIKLSELAIGIGPFVVGPAIERKIGLSALSQLAINATEFQSATWAAQQGLYAEVFESTKEMDKAIGILATKLTASSPEAMRQIKKILWENYQHWDELLPQRAAISGALVLSDFTREALKAFIFPS